MSDFDHQLRHEEGHAAAVILLIQEVQKSVDSLRLQLVSNSAAHRDDLSKAVSEILERSFPDGDAESHRRHHEAAIRVAQERAKFWATMRYELTKYGLIGFLGWALYYLWIGFLKGPQQ